ncbi:hypothetical protein ABZ832_14940 [Streptantibioticus parmotrematis]|uniref:hypothetical protein n=1 Tax=Streptantibioticus parmotrematis TaxID=2873249 RepID=UPI0033D75173
MRSGAVMVMPPKTSSATTIPASSDRHRGPPTPGWSPNPPGIVTGLGRLVPALADDARFDVERLADTLLARPGAISDADGGLATGVAVLPPEAPVVPYRSRLNPARCATRPPSVQGLACETSK